MTDTDGMTASKVCQSCAVEFGRAHMGVILTLEGSVSWENDDYLIYMITDGDSESYAYTGNKCEHGCGAVLDLRDVSYDEHGAH